MGKRKPVPAAAARVAAPKERPKRARSGKQGAELREENPERSELDGGLADGAALPDGSPVEILGTESRAVETVQHEQKSNESSQGIEQSDEEDIEDEYGMTGDMVNNGNDCSDETETSCSFHRHVSHIITNEEANTLMKQNSKFKWEMPAADIPKSKWVGTGEKVQGAYDHLHDVKQKLRDHWKHTLSDHLNS